MATAKPTALPEPPVTLGATPPHPAESLGARPAEATGVPRARRIPHEEIEALLYMRQRVEAGDAPAVFRAFLEAPYADPLPPEQEAEISAIEALHPLRPRRPAP